VVKERARKKEERRKKKRRKKSERKKEKKERKKEKKERHQMRWHWVGSSAAVSIVLVAIYLWLRKAESWPVITRRLRFDYYAKSAPATKRLTTSEMMHLR